MFSTLLSYVYESKGYENGLKGVGNPRGLNTELDNATLGWLPLLPGGVTPNAWCERTALPFPIKFFGAFVQDFEASYNGLVSMLVLDRQSL